MLALVSGKLLILGSWIKVFPDIVWGGIDPEVMLRRASITVVLPAPF